MPRVLLLMSDEADDVFTFWQWLGGGYSAPRTHRTRMSDLAPLLAALTEAIPTRLTGDRTTEDTVSRVLTRGAFATPEAERELSAAFADLLVPPALARELLEESQDGATPVLIRHVPAPSCTPIPVDLLLIDPADGRPRRRLLELASVVTEPPPGLTVGRRPPRPERGGSVEAPLQPTAAYVIDPANARPGSGRLLTDVQRHQLSAAFPAAASGAVGRRFDRADLSALLRTTPGLASFFYLGHVAHGSEQGETAALELSDTSAMYGVTPAKRGWRGLSALDLVEGTLSVDRLDHVVKASEWPTGSREALPGHAIWPMPPRVALIACKSGGDLGHAEPFGLAIAFLYNGAELVTATRWTMLSDRAFRDADAFDPDADPQPMTELAVAVIAAHAADVPDPIGHLRAWQLDRLERWESGAADAASSPLTWGALVHYVDSAPATEDLQADEIATLTSL